MLKFRTRLLLPPGMAALMWTATPASAAPAASDALDAWVPLAVPATPEGAPGDFDFEHGRWRTTLRRLVEPLSGSNVWADYEGTTLVRRALGGRANLVELDVAGSKGRIQALSLRLFDTKLRRWTLNFASAASGVLAVPMTGGFGGGRRGVFYSVEDFNGKRVLVRFVIEAVDANRCRFEQAFSADAGATWEVNWIAVDTRM